MKNADINLDSLQDQFQTTRRQYRQMKSRAEAAVVEWRRASMSLFNLQLFRFKRGGHSEGRWLKTDPSKYRDRCHYGFDAQGRILIEHQILGNLDHQFNETFVKYGDGFAESIEFDGMQLSMLTRQELVNAVPVSTAWFSSHQKGFDQYTATERKIVEIDSTWSNQPHRPVDRLSAIFNCIYDASGQLFSITVTYRKVGRHPGGATLCYQRGRRLNHRF